MSVLAQLQLQATDFPWAAISPELVLFGFGIVVLLLDTADQNRLVASFSVLGLLLAGAGFAAWRAVSGAVQDPGRALVLCAAVVLAGLVQFALTWIWRERPRTLAALLTGLGFAAGLAVSVWQWVEYRGVGFTFQGQPIVATDSLLAGMVAVDGVALFTRFVVCIAGFVTVPLGFAYVEERRMHRGEYYPLLLFAATGMTLLASANDLLMVFLGIEVLSLSLYVLSGFAKRDLNSQEAALKYFLLGAFSSALLLYGIALVYGVTGSTNLVEAGAAFRSLEAPRDLSLVALALLLVGFGFKTSLVPFHMWTPDVYQGAPTPVTGFMAGATKAAAFAAFLRVFVGAFGALSWSWVPVVSAIAIVTMLAGAVLTVVQTDLKRGLGYSAIAHAGYILMGLVSVSRAGVSATLFYLMVYTLMSLGSFGVLGLLERRSHKAMAMDDLRGLGRRYPVPAAFLALFLLSLAGIPGTAGFYAKFAVISAALAPGSEQVLLAVSLVVSSLISAFFYVRVIVAMFMDPEPATAATAPPLWTTVGTSFGLAATAAAIVTFGVLPGALVTLARQAASFAT